MLMLLEFLWLVDRFPGSQPVSFDLASLDLLEQEE